MKKIYLGVAAVCAGAWMASCSSNKATMSSAELAGEWNIVEVNGEKTAGEELPFIGLDMEAKRLYGSAGCNRMMGGFELDSTQTGAIHFTQVATTRMMCPNMDLETKVLGALDKVKGFEGTETGVVLTDAEGKAVLTLAKREAQPAAATEAAVTVADLEGEWIISAVKGEAVEKLEKTPFLAFNVAESRVHGNAGCNLVNGGFSQEEGKPSSLKFSQMMSTMMAGPGMETEGKVLEALGQVSSFAVKEGQTLSLLDANGAEVLTLTKNTGEKLAK